MTEPWQPNRRQKVVLTAAAAPGLARTISEICQQAGIQPSTFFRWLEDDPDFSHAWNQIWVVMVSQYMPSIVAAQVQEALDGKTAAAKYLTEIFSRITSAENEDVEGLKAKGYITFSPDEWDAKYADDR
ncbi:MAG: hypothetical protein N2F24_16375 [Deltaproteobacteria bacterium]